MQKSSLYKTNRKKKASEDNNSNDALAASETPHSRGQMSKENFVSSLDT